MKTKELIEKLKALPQNETIQIYGSLEEDGKGWIQAGSRSISNYSKRTKKDVEK